MREEQASKFADFEAHIPIFKVRLEDLFDQNTLSWEMEKTLCTGLRLFRIICNNIIKFPDDMKYRTLNSANARIATQLFSLTGNVDEFVIAAGFVKSVKDPDHYIYENSPGGDVTALAKKVTAMIEARMRNLEMLVQMKPADRQKMEARQAEVKLDIAKARIERDEAKRILANQVRE
jgi:hypothetical protein